ncbi:hypothetical protein D3C87_309900 [compost metagenome]
MLNLKIKILFSPSNSKFIIMSETLDATTTGTKRPGFLTVLCILTFIGSGLGILSGVLGLIGTSFLPFFTTEGTMIVQVIALVASLLCLFGAVKMWGLYKQGFTFYLLGALLSIAGSVVAAVTIGSYVQETMASMSGMEGMDASLSAAMNASATAAVTAAAWMGVVWAVVVNGLFIILYAVNRKHLTR